MQRGIVGKTMRGYLSQIGRGGSPPEQVDGGTYTLTTSGTQWYWYTASIPLSITLDDTSKYWLETDLAMSPKDASGNHAAEGIDVALTSTTALTCYYQVIYSGNTLAFSWRLYKVPGVVQRGRYTHSHTAGLRNIDIALSTPVKNYNNVFINQNWAGLVGERQGTAATNQNSLWVNQFYLTSTINLRAVGYSSKTTTFTIPWQVWDPKG